jgi:hypothetical protein
MSTKLRVYKLDRDNVVQCAKTCQEMFIHAQTLLWLTVSGLDLARLGRGKGCSLVYQLTGIKGGEKRDVEETVGPLYSTRVLSLHFKDENYREKQPLINANINQLAARFPANTQFKSLTTTPETTLHTPEQYVDYINILNGKKHIQLVYLPTYHTSVEAAHCGSKVGVWLQQDALRVNSVRHSQRVSDIIFDCGTNPGAAASLVDTADAAYGISFFGSAATDFGDISEFCRAVGIGVSDPESNITKKTMIQSLRFVNMGWIGERFWGLKALTTLEIHDCGKPEQVLKSAAATSSTLQRVTLAYTGYAKNSKMPDIDCKGAKLLRTIVSNNAQLEELCVFVKSMEQINAIDFISTLPQGLKMLTIALGTEGSSDFFQPSHYLTLVQPCPELEGLGTTMHWADPTGRPILKPQIESMMHALRKLPSLQC